jgi:hypothetical protein
MRRNRLILKLRAEFGCNTRKASLARYPKLKKRRACPFYCVDTRRTPTESAPRTVAGAGLSRSSSTNLAEQNL